MRAAECCIGVRVVRIEIDGALRELARLVVRVPRCMRKKITTTQHVFICREAARGFCQGALLLKARELYSRGADDALGDIVLHREDIVDLSIVCLGPDLP